jgi:hypothetical protein
MKVILVVVMLVLALVTGSAQSLSCINTDHLFFIERNKNRNLVQYDVCLKDGTELIDPSPVKAYWVLENGETEALNMLENRLVYGVHSQRKLGTNRYLINLAAMKTRDIIVERVGDDYKASLLIDGVQSYLEKVYVESEERWSGLPKVHYVDVFGSTVNTNTPVKERLTQ